METRKDDAADRQIVTSRVFDAPRELVFDAWTHEEHVAQWWGPRGFTTTTSEMNVQAGGVWRYVMHGPDGTDYPNLIAYTEVTPPERLVYTHGTGDPNDPTQFDVTVTFADEQGKTRVSIAMLFASAAARNQVVDEFGAIDGLNQTLDRLTEHLGRKLDVTIVRTFDAPRSLVFQAWIDPQQLAQWWGPHGFTAPRCELDVRPGGALRIDMRAPDGSVQVVTGAFRQIVEPERVVFTTMLHDAAGKNLIEVLNTVTLADDGGRTKQTLHAQVLRYAPEMAEGIAGMEEGWTQSIEKLEALVKGTSS